MNTTAYTIIFENENLLVINKPSGLLVHPDGKHAEYSLVDWILEYYPQITGVGEPLIFEHKGEQITIDRPGIVHRLDRETSGVMIIAKNQESYLHLKYQFQNHMITKEYQAFVAGIVDPRGMIDEKIGRSARDIRLWTTGRGARGVLRDAITRYVREKIITGSTGKQFSFVRLFPQTGRTHQLRVHMKSIHHPIIGDGLYAPKTVGDLGFDRVALHAYKITFQDLDTTKHTIIAPLPNDFEKILTI